MKNINQKIIGFKVLAEDDPKNMAADIDPLTKHVERRPEGELSATSEKIEYFTSEGKKTIYFIISYMPITGRINGKQVTIERPVEFFLPAGQSAEDSQWITSTMRLLSLVARNGSCVRALQDMRKVVWTKGPVRCGKKDYGNGKLVPVNHDSETAAIAWAIQQSLYRRGFLDVEGCQVPTHVLARKFQKAEITQQDMPDEIQSDEPLILSAKTCPQCHGTNIVRLDGCDTCMDCGHSKCA